MLLNRATLEGIEAGRITRVYRRWRRPSVRQGGTLRTRIGVLDILALAHVEASAIRDADARAAGFGCARELLDTLQGREGSLYRVDVRLGGRDPRIGLRQTPLGDATERAQLQSRLDRMDRASHTGPWTRETLALIRDQPAVRAPDLAARMRLETQVFKRRVRRLKELGLTDSLDVGYRLSPRGQSLLAGP